ncbi:MAG: hypothetical protein OEM27_01690 [Nitrospinota bacterium]|nr:hypothetical protein [Nitrospinota bacterium]
MHGLSPNGPKIPCNLIRKLFLQTQTEKVWGVSSVRAGHYISTEPGASPGQSVACCTGIPQTCSQAGIICDAIGFANGTPDSIIDPGTLTLGPGEFSLKYLSPPAYRTGRIPPDNVMRSARCENISLSCPNLLFQRQRNATSRGVGCLCLIGQLRIYCI